MTARGCYTPKIYWEVMELVTLRQSSAATLTSGRNTAVQTKAEIFDRLRGVLVELFEVDPSKVTLDARLHDDLEIDSIDTIDLILTLKDMTGRKIQPDQFRHVRTVGDAVDAIHALMAGQSAAA
jgi:acyl carrier protein